MGTQLDPTIIFVVTVIFNLGGFFFVARGWKKTVNGHFEKIDSQIGRIREDIQQVWKEVEEVKGYAMGRNSVRE